jgi:osmoprotectant transport system permease protein
MNATLILAAFGRHLELCFLSVGLGTLMAVTLGVYLYYRPRAASLWLGLTGALQTIPSLALYGLFLPVLGIGLLPAVTALTLYSLTPILRATLVSLREVDPTLTEAARGMGMDRWQILRRVLLPLARPGILSGIRMSTMYIISWATLAAFIGAGGLGDLVLGGIYNYDIRLILAGALPAVLLAFLCGAGFDRLARRFSIPGETHHE